MTQYELAEKIVNQIVKDLESRAGLEDVWDNIGEQQEIVDKWIDIVCTGIEGGTLTGLTITKKHDKPFNLREWWAT